MGLDGVELIMAIEEEFGVEILDREAEKLLTVGDIFELLKEKIGAIGPSVCLTQRVFYKLRRALIENYGMQRNMIKLDTRMSDLLSLEEVEAGSPFLELFIELKTPPFKVANKFLGLKLVNKELTMRELVQSLILLNDKTLVPEPDSEEELWFRLVKVIVNQVNVRADEVRVEASLTRDLGID